MVLIILYQFIVNIIITVFIIQMKMIIFFEEKRRRRDVWGRIVMKLGVLTLHTFTYIWGKDRAFIGGQVRWMRSAIVKLFLFMLS